MELPTLETKPQGESHVEKTEIGSYFVSNYPPFSVWSKEHVPAALKALETPPTDDRKLGLYQSFLSLYRRPGGPPDAWLRRLPFS